MSGGNANSTISYPGPQWRMLWGNGAFGNFQLDIVGFLAVLGEGSVTANAQVSALSRLFYLPRLIPAPQALLPPTRDTELRSTKAWVTGVYSGNTKEHVHYVAHVLLPEAMPAHTVRCVRVTKKRGKSSEPSWLDVFFRGQPGTKEKKKQDDVQRQKTESPLDTTTPVKAKAAGPLTWVTLLGFLLSVSLFMLSIIFGDGMSLIATILLSSLSTLIGIANKWSLKLPSRPKGAKATHGDVVIRYPNGSFLVVRCDEDVARELYFAPEEIGYNISNQAIYRIVSLFGTLILMLGIIFLANAKLQLQFAWAGAYIIINAAHWVAAAMPQKAHWDLSCYTVHEEGLSGGPGNKTFTDALWKVILLTKETSWVRKGNAAPNTPIWDEWIRQAMMIAGLYGDVKGELQDPIYPDRTPVPNGTVWLEPPKKEWVAKKAWDDIADEYNSPKQNGADVPQQMV